MYDGLIKLDQDANIVPNVAESWEWDEEAVKYTFHIKKGVLFHDGTELKASDVAFTFNLLMNEYRDYQATTAAQIDHVEVVDDYTLDVYLTAPSASFLYNCVINVKLYSEAAWETTNGYSDGVISAAPTSWCPMTPPPALCWRPLRTTTAIPSPASRTSTST